MKEFVVDSQSAGQRADVFVTTKYSEYARSALKALFEQRKVSISNEAVKPGYKLRKGDKLRVDETVLFAEPQAVVLPVIYEDRDVVVINKPAGVLTHAKGALNLEPTVASFIRRKLSDKNLMGNRAGIVHRLDRATSGLIICARNQKALNWLQEQFLSRKVKKIYLAIVEGRPKPSAAIIDIPIGRNPKRPQTFKATSAGKPAQTRYEVLKSIKKSGKDFALIELSPITGRTHQLRVHLAYIGHPVVGDSVYGRGGSKMLLHARKLELELPNRQRKVFLAPQPKEFKDFVKDG